MRHPRPRSILAALALLLVVGAGAVTLAWVARGRQISYFTDGATIRAPSAEAPLRDVLWQPPRRLPPAVNTVADENEAHVSGDGLTLLLARGRAGHGTDLFAARRTADGWGTPVALAAVNSAADELGPALAPDGLTLFFYSNRAGGSGGYDLWAARRTDGGWEAPYNLGPLVNSAEDDYGPCVTPEGDALYFASNRPRAEGGAEHGYDLYAASLAAGHAGVPRRLEALSTEHDEGAPALSPAGDFLYFASNRPGGHGGFDLHRARRADGRFAAPDNLGAPINSTANEIDPAVAAEGFGVYFSSDRGAEAAAGAEGPEYDIFFSASREVYRMRDRAAPIDWALLWSTVLPPLAWLLTLLAVVLLVLLLRAARGRLAHLRPLSIIARCLLVSVVIHCLLMLGLMVWAVTGGLPGALTGSGATQVALVSPSLGGGVLEQVLGGVAEPNEIRPTAPALAPAPPRPAPPTTPPPVALALERVPLAPPDPRASEATDAPTEAEAAPRPEMEVDPGRPAPAAPRPSAPPRVTAAETKPTAVTAAIPAPPAGEVVAPTSEADAVVALDVPPGRVRETRLVARDAVDADAPLESVVTRTVTVALPSAPSGAGPELPLAPAAAVARGPEPAPPEPHPAETPSPRERPDSTPRPARPDRVLVDPAVSAPPAAPALRPAPARDAAAPAGTTLASARAAPPAVRPGVPPGPPPTAERTSEPTREPPSPTRERDRTARRPVRVATASSPPPARAPLLVSAREIEPDPLAPPRARDVAPVASFSVATAPPPEGRPVDVPLASAAPALATSAAEDTAAAAAPTMRTVERARSDPRVPASADPARLAPAAPTTGAPAPRASAVRIVDAPPGTVAAPPIEPVETASSAPIATLDLSPAAPAAAPAVEPDEHLPTGHARAPARARPPAPSPRRPALAPSLVPHAAPPPTSALAVTGGVPRDGAPRPVAPGAPLRVASPDTRALATAPTAGLAPGPRAEASVGEAPPAGIAARTAGAPPARAGVRTGTKRRAAVTRLVPRTVVPRPDRPLARPLPDAAQRPPGARTRAPAARAPTVAFVPLPNAREGTAPRARAKVDPDRKEALPPIRFVPEPSRARAPYVARRSPAPVASPPLVATATERLVTPPPRRLPPLPARDAPATRPPVPGTRDVAARIENLDVELPSNPARPRNPYRQREAGRRAELVERMGGGEETERAVADALAWLASHQAQDGRWDSQQFDAGCGACAGPARLKVDIAVTGLSVLCFLAADHTHVKQGPYREVVARALRWLRERHEGDGDLLEDESMYSQGVATIALAEAYAMTGDPRLGPIVEAAVDFIWNARNTRAGGWRYAPGQEGDTSVLGWQVMALISARRAGLAVPPEAFDVARAWLDVVADPDDPGLYAYRPPRAATPSMTAEAMYVQQLLDAPSDTPAMRRGVAYLLEHPPRWDETQSTYYWFYATMALFQHGGEAWHAWNDRVKDVLLERQSTTGATAGSWDPSDMWAQVGGRVYQTAICALTLEVYYRYLPQYVREGDMRPDSP